MASDIEIPLLRLPEQHEFPTIMHQRRTWLQSGQVLRCASRL